MTSSYSSHNDKGQQNNQQQFQKGYGGKGTLIHCKQDFRLVPWKSVCRILRKLKLNLLYFPAVTTP